MHLRLVSRSQAGRFDLVHSGLFRRTSCSKSIWVTITCINHHLGKDAFPNGKGSAAAGEVCNT
jgi:hypothetical protein